MRVGGWGQEKEREYVCFTIALVWTQMIINASDSITGFTNTFIIVWDVFEDWWLKKSIEKVASLMASFGG